MVRSLALSMALASTFASVTFAKAKETGNPNTNADGSIAINPEQAEFMRELSTAQAGGGFLYVGQEVGQSLAQAGFIEVNPEVKDENGNLGAKLSASGIAWVEANKPTGNENTTEAKPKAAPRSFEVEAVAPMGVKGKRGGGRTGGSIYPFDSLAAPVANPDSITGLGYDFSSFHVPLTEGKDVKALLKSLSSTVSQQNSNRAIELKNENGEPIMETVTVRGKEVTRPATRNDVWFIVLETAKGDPKGEGVRVFRVDDKMPKNNA